MTGHSKLIAEVQRPSVECCVRFRAGDRGPRQGGENKSSKGLGQAKPCCCGEEGAPGKHWAGWGGGGLWRPQRTKRLGLPGYSVELKPCGGAGRGAVVAVGTVPAAPTPAIPPRLGLRTRLGVTGCQGPHSVPRVACLSGKRARKCCRQRHTRHVVSSLLRVTGAH